MGLLEALKKLQSEGLQWHTGICVYVMQCTVGKTDELDEVLNSLGYVRSETEDRETFPIYVEGYEEQREEQYTAIAHFELGHTDSPPPYHTEYRAQRWYLLHQLINELELQ